MESYLLVTTDTGAAGHVASAARGVPEVAGAEAVVGSPYDVVVRIETDSFSRLGVVVDVIHGLPGVEMVSTCEGH